jgi:hypothetical protein
MDIEPTTYAELEQLYDMKVVELEEMNRRFNLGEADVNEVRVFLGLSPLPG